MAAVVQDCISRQRHALRNGTRAVSRAPALSGRQMKQVVIWVSEVCLSRFCITKSWRAIWEYYSEAFDSYLLFEVENRTRPSNDRVSFPFKRAGEEGIMPERIIRSV